MYVIGSKLLSFGEVNLFPTERSNIVRLRNRRFIMMLYSTYPIFLAIRRNNMNLRNLIQ